MPQRSIVPIYFHSFVFHVSSSKHHVSISAVAQKVNLGNLGVRNAMRRVAVLTLGDSWRKRGFAVVVRYAIVTETKGFSPDPRWFCRYSLTTEGI